MTSTPYQFVKLRSSRRPVIGDVIYFPPTAFSEIIMLLPCQSYAQTAFSFFFPCYCCCWSRPWSYPSGPTAKQSSWIFEWNSSPANLLFQNFRPIDSSVSLSLLMRILFILIFMYIVNESSQSKTLKIHLRIEMSFKFWLTLSFCFLLFCSCGQWGKRTNCRHSLRFPAMAISTTAQPPSCRRLATIETWASIRRRQRPSETHPPAPWWIQRSRRSSTRLSTQKVPRSAKHCRFHCFDHNVSIEN